MTPHDGVGRQRVRKLLPGVVPHAPVGQRLVARKRWRHIQEKADDEKTIHSKAAFLKETAPRPERSPRDSPRAAASGINLPDPVMPTEDEDEDEDFQVALSFIPFWPAVDYPCRLCRTLRERRGHGRGPRRGRGEDSSSSQDPPRRVSRQPEEHPAQSRRACGHPRSQPRAAIRANRFVPTTFLPK